MGQTIPPASFLSRKPLAALLAIALTGILHPVSFPPFDLGWLAWLALIPLHILIHDLPPKRALYYGWLAGTVAFAGTVTWVITAMHQFGQVPFIVSALLMLLLSAYLGLYMGIYSWGFAKFQHACPNLLWLGAPALWVTLEFVRTYALSGFPWALLGYSQYQWLSVIQFADVTGVYGVSFLIVMGNVALASLLLWIYGKTRGFALPGPWASVASFICTLILVLAYGTWRVQEQANIDASAPTLSIGLVQANIDQAVKWNEAYRDETLRRYTSLSQEAGKNTDLLIWPEAATPFLFEQEPVYQSQVLDIAKDTHSSLLFGSPTLRFQQDGRPYLYNSAFLVTAAGRVSDRYDKRHLVPFGEYIPLRSILFFLDKLVVGIGDFKSGQGIMTMQVPTVPPDSGPRFGVAICFEVIFPDLVRRMAQEGANFLVTITNDAWFGDSAAPHQHFGMVVFRAVENHLAFARAANTGISGFIAPDGRILSRTSIFSEQAVTGLVPLRSSSPTFYTQFGDVFSWGCVIMAGILFTWCRFTTPLSTRKPRPLPI
ncbi:apolipoprotein N-acyltransferase [uncultured Nitrospira sp.]|uniref:apolipoprotein N-acyltransferase n=1 Tax=uncultured Nitrospira sp. TaxID=157176 RepID=UPI00314074C1